MGGLQIGLAALGSGISATGITILLDDTPPFPQWVALSLIGLGLALVLVAVIWFSCSLVIRLITRRKAKEISPLVSGVGQPPEPKLGSAPVDSNTISLARLPSTSSDLFGREVELARLDAAWGNPQTNLVSLVAWGGVGKTALVKVWLNRMGQDYFGGAERVYGWSFHSQGAAEGRQASGDLFIAAALEWFGDPNPDQGSPWDKGERLAELVRRQRTLLVLDGLEPLQHPPAQSEQEGRLKDPGLQSLLRGLAHRNPGLCLLTTRLPVDDLKEFTGTLADFIDLEELSPEAGVQLLESLGVKGTPDELREAVGEFEGHALALTLLGEYLAIVYSGDIRQRDKVPPLVHEPDRGGHARRVMESYEEWFEGKPELNILRLMSLFDQPVEEGAFQALIADPGIEGLTAPRLSLIARVGKLFRPIRPTGQTIP